MRVDDFRAASGPVLAVFLDAEPLLPCAAGMRAPGWTTALPGSDFLATDFLAIAFPATDFLATDFVATDFLATDFLVTGFAATDFLAAGFFTTDFVATDFLAADFVAAAPVAALPTATFPVATCLPAALRLGDAEVLAAAFFLAGAVAPTGDALLRAGFASLPAALRVDVAAVLREAVPVFGDLRVAIDTISAACSDVPFDSTQNIQAR